MAPSEICNPAIPIPETLWHSFDTAVAKTPGAIAYSVLYQPADHLSNFLPHGTTPRVGHHLAWSFSNLKHATVRVAAGMLERGVQRGSTLVTFLPNGMERELLSWVSVSLQLTLLPLDAALFDPGRKDELQHYITSVTPHIVVVKDDWAAAEWDKQSPGSEALKVSVEPSSRPHWLEFGDLLLTQNDLATQEKSVAQQDLEIEDDNERIAAILYTSGTSSGKPKGCAISSRQLLTAAQVFDLGHIPFKSMVVFSTNSRSMSNWLTSASIQYNVTVVLPSPMLDIGRLLDAVEEHNIDAALLMPYMLYDIARDAKFACGERDLSCVKVILLGGDVITTDMIARAQKIFPKAGVGGGHGMSEAIGCTNMIAKRHGEESAPTVFGNIICAGPANQAASHRICDGEGRVLERGQVGELHYGGPLVMKRYWRDVQPELFYTDDKTNWMLTGDRALMDEQGRLYVIGRSKDIIKKKGVTFSPAVISSTLNSQPGIVAAVFGIPHKVNGEAIVAVVEHANPPNSRERIRAIVVDSLGADHALDELYTLADLGMDTFPIGVTGKVLNLTLKEAVLKLKDRRDSVAT